MEKPTRKGTRLTEYDYSQNGYYFVTICTKERRKLFGEIVGGGAFDAPHIQLSAIGTIVDKYIQSTNKIPHITVDKYVIMPNHIHLLLRICNMNGTSRAPSPTKSTHANQLLPHAVATMKRFINRDVGYNVFQRSYYDHVVRGEQDYREIWQYIDQNPVQWQNDRFFSE